MQIWAQGSKPEVKHPAGNFVSVNGAEIWYEGEGEPVLLIPGGPGNSHTYFHPWFSDLAKYFKVIYFDAVGRGNRIGLKILRSILSAGMLKMSSFSAKHSDLKSGL